MTEVAPNPPNDLPLGQLVATPSAITALTHAGQHAAALLNRHRRGDWGDIDQQDKSANDFAVHHGERVLSAYQINGTTRIWIITEADRSATTILLPGEY